MSKINRLFLIVLLVVSIFLVGCSDEKNKKIEEIELEFIELNSWTCVFEMCYQALFVSHDTKKFYKVTLTKYDYDFWKLDPADKLKAQIEKSTNGSKYLNWSELAGEKARVYVSD